MDEMAADEVCIVETEDETVADTDVVMPVVLVVLDAIVVVEAIVVVAAVVDTVVGFVQPKLHRSPLQHRKHNDDRFSIPLPPSSLLPNMELAPINLSQSCVEKVYVRH